MDALEAIEARRSIRKFEDKPVPRELVEQVLEAAVRAPSGKNRQPWRFIVVEGDEARAEMMRRMRESIEGAREAGVPLGSSENTARVMGQAPSTIFVFNGESVHYKVTDWTVPDLQSIGAAVQNMCLAATDHGLGSLWICDVFYADRELREWFGREDKMVCAVSLGYPAEKPAARPRRPWQEVTTWLDE